MDEEPKGKLDGISYLYIIGGIPAILAFLVVLFALARSCNIPA